MRAKSLLLTAPKRLEWIETDLPDPGANELLVETLSGAISVGTELPHFLGKSRGVAPTYPAMTGYENLAHVLACGASIERLMTGDRIVSFYGHRTHALIPEDKAIRVPEHVSDELAILSILSCDVAKGVRKVMPQPKHRVLITGAGTIGLLTLWTLRRYGVERVDVIEPQANRRQLASRFGAANVFSADGPDLIDDEYSFGFECSSRDVAFATLQRSMRHDGMICVLADGNLEPLTLTPDFHQKELRVVGSSDGWDYHAHARWFFEQAAGDESLLKQLFQWTVTAGDLPDTFRRLATATPRPIKVFVRYGA